MPLWGVTVDSPSGGVVSSRRPQIEWSFNTDGLVHRITIWVCYTTPSYGVPSDSNVPEGWSTVVYKYTNAYAYESPYQLPHVPTSDLPFGDLFVVVLADVISPSAERLWNDGSSFSFEDSLSAPTNVVPLSGATVLTNLPALQATLVPTTYGAQQKAQWQIATDAGFTTNLKTITQSDSDLKTSGVASKTVEYADRLFAGSSWRVRARAINAGGQYSAWTSANSFTVSHAPSAVVTSPYNGAGFAWNSGSLTISWLFSSTSSDMSQTAYRVLIEKVSDSSTVYDSGKTTSTINSAVISGLSTGIKGVALRVKVKLWDTEDVEGAWSDYVPFTMHDPGTVAVSAPTGTISTPGPTAEWTFTPSTGGDQVKFRITVHNDTDDELTYDSDWVTSTDVEYTLPTTSGIENGKDYTLTVTVRDGYNVEASDTITFDTTWTTPAVPDFTVEHSTFDTDGPVTILIDAVSAADPEFAGWRVRRRVVGDTDWTLVAETTLGDDWVRVADYRALANVEQEWVVDQIVTRFGTTIYSSNDDLSPVSDTPTGSTYWLIIDENTSIGGSSAPAISGCALSDLSVKLTNVIDDGYTNQTETAVIQIVGRGNKVEYGTAYGVTGTLSALIFNDSNGTAYEKRRAIDDFKSSNDSAALRNPFGQTWQVALSDIQLSREQGPTELSTIVIPYTEIAQ